VARICQISPQLAAFGSGLGRFGTESGRILWRMTSQSISPSYRDAAAGRRRSIVADLAFWSVVGAIVAALSKPAGEWWRVPQPVLLAGGVSFAALGVGLLIGLSRIRFIPRGLVWGFGASNLLLAPIAWLAAALRWLPLSAAGNLALITAGLAALVLGSWQLNALRRS
jgi:hypothetical protein